MMLMGPTGAGQSFLARRIYELKKARHQIDGRFFEINCATLHGDGAASDRPGLLRSAHRGLLFLDEIGELGPDEQAMLLKAIEEKRFLPMGSDHEVQSDFQLIAGEAAARLDLFDAMQLGSVIGVCRQSRSLSDAGRKLYAVSRVAKSKPNDADRLKKFLARFDLCWEQVGANTQD